MLFGGVRQAGDETHQCQGWMRKDDLGVKVGREDYSHEFTQCRMITDSDLVLDSNSSTKT